MNINSTIIVALAATLTGCATAATATTAAATTAAAEPPRAPASPSPVDQLSSLDTRTPVPLQPMMAWHQKQNMLGHLLAIQHITAALSHDPMAQDDWDAAGTAATTLTLSPQMQMQCEHMGAQAPGFTEIALDFHHRADAIVTAVQAKDTAAALAATAHTLEACTGCHATYRQELVAGQGMGMMGHE